MLSIEQLTVFKEIATTPNTNIVDDVKRASTLNAVEQFFVEVIDSLTRGWFSQYLDKRQWKAVVPSLVSVAEADVSKNESGLDSIPISTRELGNVVIRDLDPSELNSANKDLIVKGLWTNPNLLHKEGICIRFSDGTEEIQLDISVRGFQKKITQHIITNQDLYLQDTTRDSVERIVQKNALDNLIKISTDQCVDFPNDASTLSDGGETLSQLVLAIVKGQPEPIGMSTEKQMKTHAGNLPVCIREMCVEERREIVAAKAVHIAYGVQNEQMRGINLADLKANLCEDIHKHPQRYTSELVQFNCLARIKQNQVLTNDERKIVLPGCLEKIGTDKLNEDDVQLFKAIFNLSDDVISLDSVKNWPKLSPARIDDWVRIRAAPVYDNQKMVKECLKHAYGLHDVNLTAANNFLSAKDSTRVDSLQLLHLAKLHGVLSKIGVANAHVSAEELDYFLRAYDLENTFDRELKKFQDETGLTVPVDKLKEYSDKYEATGLMNVYNRFLNLNPEFAVQLGTLNEDQLNQLNTCCLNLVNSTEQEKTELTRVLRVLLNDLGVTEVEELIDQQLDNFSHGFAGRNTQRDFETFLDEHKLGNIKSQPAKLQTLSTFYRAQVWDVTAETLGKLPKLAPDDIKVLFAVEYERNQHNGYSNELRQKKPLSEVVTTAIQEMVDDTFRPKHGREVTTVNAAFVQFSDEEVNTLKPINGNHLALNTMFDKICYRQGESDSAVFSMVHPVVGYALNHRYGIGNDQDEQMMHVQSNPNIFSQYADQYARYSNDKANIDVVLQKVYTAAGNTLFLTTGGGDGCRNNLCK